MSSDLPLLTDTPDLGRFAAAFALGLLLMGYATMTYWQAAYAAVNPAVGSLAVSTGGVLFYVGLFLAGAMLSFVAALSGLHRVLVDVDG